MKSSLLRRGYIPKRQKDKNTKKTGGDYSVMGLLLTAAEFVVQNLAIFFLI
jgi:hypothetical protein